MNFSCTTQQILAHSSIKPSDFTLGNVITVQPPSPEELKEEPPAEGWQDHQFTSLLCQYLPCGTRVRVIIHNRAVVYTSTRALCVDTTKLWAAKVTDKTNISGLLVYPEVKDCT